MAEYIDREEVIDKLTMLFPLLKKRTIKSILKAVPSADVQPVVHGHWVMEEYDYPCSVCGETVAYEYDVRILKYCPNCGATMDDEDKK